MCFCYCSRQHLYLINPSVMLATLNEQKNYHWMSILSSTHNFSDLVRLLRMILFLFSTSKWKFVFVGVDGWLGVWFNFSPSSWHVSKPRNPKQSTNLYRKRLCWILKAYCGQTFLWDALTESTNLYQISEKREYILWFWM